jgi:leucine-rich repeat protein SHOC2
MVATVMPLEVVLMGFSRVAFLLALVLVLLGSGFASAQVPQTEREALIAFYWSLDGPNWTNNSGWLGPVGTECNWAGVDCTSAPNHVDELFRNYLGGNGLAGSVPPEIEDMPYLWYLNFTLNDIVSLPSEIGNLPALGYLYIANNQLTAVPPTIGNLSQLQLLDLANNALVELPDGIGGLVALEELLLQNNLLVGLPGDIGGMVSLRYLRLQNNSLVSLPSSIGNLSGLQFLNLDNNQITQLPSSIGSLLVLRILRLDSNQLTALPSEIGNLASLEILYLGDNQIASLPTGISGILNLEYLYLNGNQLSALPGEFSDLQQLRNLYLNRNRFTSFPTLLLGLPTINLLGLSENQITTIPPEIGNLAASSLGLASNRINSLPIEILNSGISSLTVDWNAIKADDPALWWYLYNFNPNWTASQTISPDALEYERISDRTAMMTWWPIDYTVDPGGYEVLYRENGSSTWLSAGWTPSKFVTRFPVTNLSPGTGYEVAVRSFTYPHLFNDNYVESLESQPLSAATSDFGCSSPTITVQGGGPFTLNSSPADSYRWSTGETSQSIVVDPDVDTWYWVTTTVGGCEESATVLATTSGVFSDGFESGDTSAWSDVMP